MTSEEMIEVNKLKAEYNYQLIENSKLKEKIHTLKVYLEGCANYLILNGDTDNPIIDEVEKILGYRLNRTPN